MLKREISTLNILVASAGGMIGSGWLFSPYLSAQMAGSNALIGWILATIFMLFIALPLCELGAMLPISGGMTTYPSFTHGQELGFLFAWVSWLSYVVMTPIEIQAILQYGSHFFPTLIDGNSASLRLSTVGYGAAILIMIFVVVLNSYGIKFLAECNKYASLIKFLLPTMAIIGLLHQASSFNNIHISLGDKSSWIELFGVLSDGGMIFAFTGFQNGLMLAGEVNNPQRNLPIAILGAIVIGCVFYFMLEFAFLAAMPETYLSHGWHRLVYPGDSGPMVGLLLLMGLPGLAWLLMFDAAFSPFGTTLIYTAATSRILYGMSLNQYLPTVFLKVNRHGIPYVSLYTNLMVGILAFLPFPGWGKLVAFLSSVSILSYAIGPICLLAMRQLQPDRLRPFRLRCTVVLSHLAFYLCNLMLYWCGFDVIWKLDVALILGLVIYLVYHKQSVLICDKPLWWFGGYMAALNMLSYLGSFGGIGWLVFPLDALCWVPVSMMILQMSQRVLNLDDQTGLSSHLDALLSN